MIILILGLLLNQVQARASGTLPQDIICLSGISRALNAAGTVEKWLPFPNGVAGNIPGFGSAEIHVNPGHSLFVLDNKRSRTTFLLRTPECHPEVLSSAPTFEAFTDLSLAQTMAQPKGFILIWSPHMELSITEVENLTTAKINYPVTVILDPKASMELAQEVAKKHHWPESYLRPMHSRALEEKGIGLHYPSAVFYKDGKILRRVPGYSGRAMASLAEGILK